MILSVFAKNVFTLYITIGFGTGFGFGMIYLPAIVCVTMYFERLRSLATGIAVCGSGFGTVVFAPLTNYLITTYQWQGSLLVIAGIVFFCAIFGYMFKPLNLEEAEDIPLPIITENNNNAIKPLNTSEHDLVNASHHLLPQQITRSHSIGNDMIKNKNIINLKVTEEKNRASLSLSQPLLNESAIIQRALKPAVSGTLRRPDALYTGSLHNLGKHRSHNSIHTATDRYGSLRSRVDNVEEHDGNTKVCGCIPCSQEAHDSLKQMMSFALLKDPVFIIFVASNFLTR